MTRVEALETEHHRLVPVAVDMDQGDRLRELERVLEQAAMQAASRAVDGQAVPREGRDDLLVEIVAIA